MIKLSELDDEKVIDESGNVEDATDVKQDFEKGYLRGGDAKYYTTKKYHASIDAWDMLERAIESESDNMYDYWENHVTLDVTNEDLAGIQAILDDILGREKEQNIGYCADKEIDIFN